MRTFAVVATALVAAAALVPGATADGRTSRPRCTAGQTMFVEGKLRLFAIRWRTAHEWGYDTWACRGTRGRAVGVGGFASGTGTASAHTPRYTLAGGRYLGIYNENDGEGGPSAWVTVVDLASRRTIGYANTPFYDEFLPSLRVASNGVFVISSAESVMLHRGRKGEGRDLAGGGPVTDLAMVGATVYWTEESGTAPAARSAALEGVDPTAPESYLLEPAELPKRASCAATRGRTVAASPRVRVYERGSRRYACHGSRRARAGSAGDPLPRIVADRWVLLRDELGVGVLDARRGRIVTRADGKVGEATLLVEGTLAWLDGDGRLLAQRAADDSPTELAPASAAPTALAAGRKAAYWIAGGAPHQFRP